MHGLRTVRSAFYSIGWLIPLGLQALIASADLQLTRFAWLLAEKMKTRESQFEGGGLMEALALYASSRASAPRPATNCTPAPFSAGNAITGTPARLIGVV
jgi:hypothetical protein